MKFAKEKTVAFTGNRTLTTADGRPDTNLENVLRTELSFCLEDCYQEGKNVFVTGMALGWDMLCAEEVLKLKAKYPDVLLIAAIPFPGQELLYKEKDKQRYKRIYESADHREFITDGGYNTEAYHKRNDWMIANSSEIIAYDSGKPRSGTASTVRKSHLAGLEILNIFDELKNYFAISHSAKLYLQRFPHVTSFRYGREGVIFEGDNQPHPLNFEQIESVVEKGDFLMFTLRNGVTYKASVFTDECFVNIGKSAILS